MNDRFGDVLTLLVGFGVFPLAVLVWATPGSGWVAGILRLSSLLWVPGGVLLLILWFQDNPPSSLPIFRRIAKDLRLSPKATFALVPLTAVPLFLALLLITSGHAIMTGEGRYEAQSNSFMAGIFTLIGGLVITFGWLGGKEDYSRTAYVLKGSGTGAAYGPRPFPRADPGPQPSEQQRESQRRGALLADVLGLSVTVTGLLLMISSTFFA